MHEETDRALVIFQALADPTRLKSLRLLREMELSVGELAQVLGQSQPRVSRHVKILVDAGLVSRRKEGSWVFLALGPERTLSPVFAALESWASQEGAALTAVDRQRLQAVRTVRAGEAEDWFETHAAEWDALRSLHVPETAVESEILRLLGPSSLGKLVDIGTGTGRMLELLAGRAVSAVGFDRSPAMLRLARTKLENVRTKDGKRIELQQGNFYALPLAGRTADTVVLHQVLRYAQHPAAVIAECARLLEPGGRLLVVDFAPYEREALPEDGRSSRPVLRTNAREGRGRKDGREGFDDDQIDAWFRAAGLGLAPPCALEGALTVKLWLGRAPTVPFSNHARPSLKAESDV